MLLRTGLALAGLLVVAQSANAEVYCKSVGVPKGCVMRPDTPGAGAPGVGVAPGGAQARRASAWRPAPARRRDRMPVHRDMELSGAARPAPGCAEKRRATTGINALCADDDPDGRFRRAGRLRTVERAAKRRQSAGQSPFAALKPAERRASRIADAASSVAGSLPSLMSTTTPTIPATPVHVQVRGAQPASPR